MTQIIQNLVRQEQEIDESLSMRAYCFKLAKTEDMQA